MYKAQELYDLAHKGEIHNYYELIVKYRYEIFEDLEDYNQGVIAKQLNISQVKLNVSLPILRAIDNCMPSGFIPIIPDERGRIGERIEQKASNLYIVTAKNPNSENPHWIVAQAIAFSKHKAEEIVEYYSSFNLEHIVKITYKGL